MAECQGTYGRLRHSLRILPDRSVADSVSRGVLLWDEAEERYSAIGCLKLWRCGSGRLNRSQASNEGSLNANVFIALCRRFLFVRR